ncbi:ShlB/FhaC/HecB family hemolysin secretion/activation protein [Chelonobacter oris]|uniref:ShlB/FhaC/HecB family hemolysin secretion/activation protein n=1 Tax=Chelonobacter oris TaxID=505317 RepID=UPI003133872F
MDFKQRFPYRLTLSLDDSGSRSTGRLQGTATISIENLLSLNDLFYTAFTHSFKRGSDDSGERGSQNVSAYYAVPWKNWLLSASVSQYDYHQTVFGPFVNYEYAGKSTHQNITLSRLLYRDASRKTSANVGIWHRRSANFTDNAEIDVQRRRMAGWEIGVNHREYLGRATLEVYANYKRGTGANRALAAPEEFHGEGTSRPKILTAGISFKQPFTLGEQPWQFTTSWRGQWNKTPLIPQDRFSIGGRYTVRGFDGELTLSADRGWLWRNELAWNVMNSGQELYWGVDKGVVRGRSTADLAGRHLVGGVMGLRGELWGLHYDYFVGVPIHKPQGFRTSHVTTGFSLSYQF